MKNWDGSIYLNSYAVISFNRTVPILFGIVGAKAVAVGTANFVNPHATIDIIEGIESFMREEGISDINQIIGSLKI